MTVSGGFAGVNQEVVLRGDGSVRTSDRGESEVRRTTTAQFTELRKLLADPALADVPAVTRNTGAADMFQYTLRFDGRTVTTDRSAAEPALDRLIDALAKWLPPGTGTG
ncbi:protealysin inhibitor emfourin [Streptomyces sp. yr375]|uniref:protealysin inhibitor emfourin n=1 Tax=Streptomyces sp. yr375 TaxID=1761906 RepID=UPI00210AA9AD|nr:protealysin inhibitor emfourin [Streptomyces sp. yr375]